jgi:hypothetical protein
VTQQTAYAYGPSDFGDSLPRDPWAATQTRPDIVVMLSRAAEPVELTLGDDALASPVAMQGHRFESGTPLRRLWSLVDAGKGTRITAYEVQPADRPGAPVTVLTTALPLTPGRSYALSRPMPVGLNDARRAGGLASGTRVLTQAGKRRVEDIAVGDTLWTEGAGFQPVLWHGVQSLPGRGEAAPVCLRRGQLGAANDLWMIGTQCLRVDTGDGPVLVPAAALAEAGLADREFGASVTWHQLLLPVHALIHAEGLAMASLYAPDRHADGAPEGWPDNLQMPAAPVLPRLSTKDACALLG